MKKDPLSDVAKKRLFEIFEVGRQYYFAGSVFVFAADGLFHILPYPGRTPVMDLYGCQTKQVRVPVSLIPKIEELKQELSRNYYYSRFKNGYCKTDKLIDDNIDLVVFDWEVRK